MTEDSETLELYRIMVETVTANEQRRQQISSVFITLLAAGFGAAGAIQDFDMVYATAPALVVSFVWFAQVRFLKRLATAKFHVIGKLEEKLSFHPFAEEWSFLKRDNPKRKWLRLGLSDIEMIVPIAVFVASCVHLTWVAWQAFECGGSA